MNIPILMEDHSESCKVSPDTDACIDVIVGQVSQLLITSLLENSQQINDFKPNDHVEIEIEGALVDAVVIHCEDPVMCEYTIQTSSHDLFKVHKTKMRFHQVIACKHLLAAKVALNTKNPSDGVIAKVQRGANDLIFMVVFPTGDWQWVRLEDLILFNPVLRKLAKKIEEKIVRSAFPRTYSELVEQEIQRKMQPMITKVPPVPHNARDISRYPLQSFAKAEFPDIPGVDPKTHAQPRSQQPFHTHVGSARNNTPCIQMHPTNQFEDLSHVNQPNIPLTSSEYSEKFYGWLMQLRQRQFSSDPPFQHQSFTRMDRMTGSSLASPLVTKELVSSMKPPFPPYSHTLTSSRNVCSPFQHGAQSTARSVNPFCGQDSFQAPHPTYPHLPYLSVANPYSSFETIHANIDRDNHSSVDHSAQSISQRSMDCSSSSSNSMGLKIHLNKTRPAPANYVEMPSDGWTSAPTVPSVLGSNKAFRLNGKKVNNTSSKRKREFVPQSATTTKKICKEAHALSLLAQVCDSAHKRK